MLLFLRKLSLVFGTLFAATLVAEPLSAAFIPPAQSTPLGTTFVDWESIPARYGPVGLFRSVFDAPTPTLEKFEVHVTTLRPGMSPHQPHHHPWEEMLLMIEGDVEVSINGLKHRAGPGFLIFFASHDVHNLVNIGDKPATYFVINFYTDAVHTVPSQSAAIRNVPGMLPSSVTNCDSLPATPTKTGYHREIVDSATLTFLELESHVTILNPGGGRPANVRDPGDEFFVIKSGAIEASVNGVAHQVRVGSCFYVAPNDERSFKNVGATPASYQVIKVVSHRTPGQPGI
jgi:quercetin dioxygenase-like cupin family protein